MTNAERVNQAEAQAKSGLFTERNRSKEERIN